MYLAIVDVDISILDGKVGSPLLISNVVEITLCDSRGTPQAADEHERQREERYTAHDALS